MTALVSLDGFMPGKAIVYALREDGESLARYVGVTGGSLVERICAHRTSTKANPALREWLSAIGDRMVVDILARPPKDDMRVHETLWIRKYWSEGHPLFNRVSRNAPFKINDLTQTPAL